MATSIDDSNVNIKFDDYIKDIDKGNIMFVMSTTESEILDIVMKLNGKRSEDVNGLCLNVLKNVICSVIKPIAYIANLSFSSGIFTNDLKIVRVIPLFRSSEVYDVSIIDRFNITSIMQNNRKTICSEIAQLY